MSTQTFVNALIGLAREHKTAERRLAKRFSTKHPNGALPQFGAEIADYMADSGYFHDVDVNAFGEAVDRILYSSDPRRKSK